jgi:drug/metabolite transporter (DMT)-like permease
VTDSRLHLRANLLLLAITMVWGATFVVVKGALADASPTLFNLLRMVLACVFLLVVYRPRLTAIERRQWIGGTVVGALLAAGYQFQTIGLKYTTASKSAFITGAVVVLVPLFAGVVALLARFFRAFSADGFEPPRPRAYAGALLAFAGLGVLTLPSASSPLAMLRGINAGDALTFGCSIAFAVHIVVMSRVAKFTSYSLLAILQSGFAAAFLLVLLPAYGRPQFHATPRLAIALAVTGVLATAVAFAVQSYAQNILPPTNVALLMAMEPVFAWITSYVVLGERLGIRGGIGAAMVMAGILVTELRW